MVDQDFCSFSYCICTAFALSISPNHVWALPSYVFAKHVDQHAEELRGRFVQHQGKKRFEVIANGLVVSGVTWTWPLVLQKNTGKVPSFLNFQVRYQTIRFIVCFCSLLYPFFFHEILNHCHTYKRFIASSPLTSRRQPIPIQHALPMRSRSCHYDSCSKSSHLLSRDVAVSYFYDTRVEFNIPDTLARNAISQPIFIFTDMDWLW